MARGRGEAARRSAVGGRGNKPIGVVPKAEVGRLSESPRCALRGSVAGSFLRAFRTATYTQSASGARRRGLKIADRDGERAEQRHRCTRLIRVCRREL